MQKNLCYIILLFACIFFSFSTIAAPGKPFAKADSIARLIPAEAAKTTQSLAAFIAKTVQDETERIKVIYVWIAYHIAYDVEATFITTTGIEQLEDAQFTLSKRKGVCIDYASLFNELAKGVGIKSSVVSGMIKMPDGEFSNVAHAWNVALIDGVWHRFDPTWGAGFVAGLKFEKRFSARWFMSDPEDFISTHLPFDPIWQLQSFPITGNQFFKPDAPLQDTSAKLNYMDSIAEYETQKELERILATAKRMRKETRIGGVERMPETYKLIRNKYYEMELMGGIYYAATNQYNMGIEKLNIYTMYYNRQFQPVKSDPAIQVMIDVPEKYFTYTTWLLNKIETNDKALVEDVKKLHALVAGVKEFLTKENAFLKLYFSTPPQKRERLFYVKR